MDNTEDSHCDHCPVGCSRTHTENCGGDECGAASLPQPAAGDLERDVRAALEAAWTVPTSTAQQTLDHLVPVAVRLIEEQRAPLVAEMEDRVKSWRKAFNEQLVRAEKAEARVRELEAALTAKPESLQAAVVSIKRGNDHLLAQAERAEAAIGQVRVFIAALQEDEREEFGSCLADPCPVCTILERLETLRGDLDGTETTR